MLRIPLWILSGLTIPTTSGLLLNAARAMRGQQGRVAIGHMSSPPSNPLKLSPAEIGPAIPAVLGIGQAHFVSQTLHAMVKLGVPNIIGADNLSAEEIAANMPGKPNTEMLGRSLRLLSAATGLFVESAHPSGAAAYGLSTTGALLQTGVKGQPSMACGVLHWLEKPMWNAWSELPAHIAGEGDTPFTAANGKPVFDFYAENPESAAPFNEFMTFFSLGELPIVTDMFDWTPYNAKTVIDVGGSYGSMMETLKAKFPSITTISFDLPEVITAAGTPPDGVIFVGGDFFDTSTIPKADGAIFMKHILHDWNDEDSQKILTSCKAALLPGGKVIVAEAVLPGPGEASDLKVPQSQLDTLMGIIGGKERTRAQWDALAAVSGFVVEDVMQSPSPACQILTLAPA
jgi:hypothetical protein